MPADYTGTIHIRDDNKEIIVSGFCRDGKRRVSIRVDGSVAFMDVLEVLSLMRELAIAVSKPCYEHHDRHHYEHREKQYRDKEPPKKQEQKQSQSQLLTKLLEDDSGKPVKVA